MSLHLGSDYCIARTMALDWAVPVALVALEINAYSQHSMESRIRPLTEAERRLVRRHLRRLERDRATHWPRVIGVTALVVGILWLLTVLASDAPLWVISAFWCVLGIVLAAWVGRERGASPVLSTRSCKGARLPLERTVPADFKTDMIWPGDLEVRAGTLADLETVLLRDFTPER